MSKNSLIKPSFVSQVVVLVTRAFDILSNDIKRVLMIAFLPILAAEVIVLVGKDSAFSNFENTKINLFSLVCATVFIGIFNSLQEVCKERHILKREYMTNLRMDSYICAKVVVQVIICFFQTLVLSVIFFNSFHFSNEGLIFYSSIIDGFITIFLLMLAASMTGLFISSIVKNQDMANLIAPIVILFQIVFSDALTELSGNVEKISCAMISKWGMDGLSAIVRLDQKELAIQELVPFLPEIPMEFNFEPTASYICKVWIILVCFSIVLALLSGVALKNVSRDKR